MTQDAERVLVCGCPSPTVERINPSTTIQLLLCEAHAALHDMGYCFPVHTQGSK